jgi:meso-butanediol dehydrogenase/(S,S)-butanediol dehydrogenase/diacetyl reductase
MSRLANKSALITGGAAGIGKACALLFCREGAAVTLVDLDLGALELAAEAIRAELPSARVSYFPANVADRALADQAVAHAVLVHGGLDILVNNAAMRNHTAIAEASLEEWEAMTAVNLFGTTNYCRAALPHLRRSGKGSIVNVSSCYAVTGRKGMGLYDATKAGQLALTRTLAHEEAAHGVRVNVVCPGPTLTDFQLTRAKAAGKSIGQLMEERSDVSLLRRWATPEEIAHPILWMASEESSFMTGTTVVVDGGLHIM